MRSKKVILPHELARRRRIAARVVRILHRFFPTAKIALRYGNPWELLVAVMLSAQSTDKKVNEVTAKLFKKYRALNDYVNADPREFQEDVKVLGLFRTKTKNILATAKIIREKFGGKIPRTMDEMLLLPGVARKTANVVLGNAHGVVLGIAVDTHVRRLSRLLGLTDENDPNKIERDLMQILPKKEWFDFNHRMVLYGREYCPARPHDHKKCPLSHAT